jgi:signal transduction histidine kinase
MVEADRGGSPTRAFLVRLLVDEESLYGLLLVERVVVPAFLCFWMAFAGAHRAALVAVSLFAFWELVTSLAMRSRLDLLKRRPLLLLSIEQAACTAVFLGVGPWRGTFYYTLASPTVFAAIFVGTGLALLLAGMASAVAVVSIGIFHLPDGRGQNDRTTVEDWGGAPLLFMTAAVLVSLIRRLLDQVAKLGRRADTTQAELNRMRQAAVEENARKALTSEFHDDIRQALTSLPARWRTIAAMPGFADRADALRAGAALAEKGGGDVKALLIAYRPSSPEQSEEIPVNDGEDVLAEVAKRERGYFRAIVIARLVFAAWVGFFLIDARGPRFWWIMLLWSALLVWVVATSVAWRQLYPRLKTRPALLAIEEAVMAGLLLFGTTENGNLFWIMGVTAPVLATSVGTITRAAGYTTFSAVAAFASIHIAHHERWQIAPPSPAGTFAATLGYAAPVLPALYIRFLFNRLQKDAQRLQSQSAEAERLRLEVAVDVVRREATPRLIEQVRPVVEGLKASLARIESDNDVIVVEKARVVELEKAIEALEADPRARMFSGHAPQLLDVLEVSLLRLRRLGGEAAVTGDVPRVRVSVDRAESLMHLVAEALTNALRHGRPPIELSAHDRPGSVAIVVADHGPGFEVDDVLARNGLWILRRYEAMAAARVEVTTDDSGTQVRIELDV